MNTLYNPHISVDVVVFGFDDNTGLKVLLIDRDKNESNVSKRKKLPGNLISLNEWLHDSAVRVLQEYTGIENLYLKQFAVFDNPDRIKKDEDLQWLMKETETTIERVVTIAFYSLVNFKLYAETELSRAYNAKWCGIEEVPKLIFDHNQIIEEGLNTLKKEFLTEPLGFKLLPDKFTINQLQRITEAILGVNVDNRNFRKRISRLEYIVPLVEHKPARYYMFDQKKLDSKKREHTGFII